MKLILFIVVALLPWYCYAYSSSMLGSKSDVTLSAIRPGQSNDDFKEYRIDIFDDKLNVTQNPDTGEIVLRLCNIFVGPTAPGDAEFRIEIWSVSYLVDTAELYVDLDFKACLEIFVDPCSERAGLRFAMEEDFRVIPTVDLGLGFSTKDLFGFTIDIKDSLLHEWRLPPILDGFKPPKEEMCADINIKFLPKIQLCFMLEDFKLAYSGITMCPSVLARLGSKNLLKIDYHGLTGGDCPYALPSTSTCACPIGVGFVPDCFINGTKHNVTTLTSFKSFDFNSDFVVNKTEWHLGLSRFLGTAASSKDAQFDQMDTNGDGLVHFTEYAAFTEQQKAIYVASLQPLGAGAVAAIILFVGVGIAGAVFAGVLYKKPELRRRVKGMFSSSKKQFNARLDAYENMDPEHNNTNYAPPVPGRAARGVTMA